MCQIHTKLELQSRCIQYKFHFFGLNLLHNILHEYDVSHPSSLMISNEYEFSNANEKKDSCCQNRKCNHFITEWIGKTNQFEIFHLSCCGAKTSNPQKFTNVKLTFYVAKRSSEHRLGIPQMRWWKRSNLQLFLFSFRFWLEIYARATFDSKISNELHGLHVGLLSIIRTLVDVVFLLSFFLFGHNAKEYFEINIVYR